jgi:hypothetical protein
MNRITTCLLATVLSGPALLAAGPGRPLDWGPAPPAAAVAEEGAGAAAPSLAELAAAAVKPPAAPIRKAPPTVIQGEWYPLAYRTILLRYFDWPPAARRPHPNSLPEGEGT